MRDFAPRSSQVAGTGITTEAVRPGALKYCVDQDYLDSLLSVDFIAEVLCYDELEDAEFRRNLEKKVASSKRTLQSSHSTVL